MIVENFLERVITHWIPFVFGYIITPFRYVYLYVIDRPLTFCLLSIILLVFCIGIFISDKLIDILENHISIVYIDIFFIILSFVLLIFSAIGLDIKY